MLTVRGGYHGDTFGCMSVCDPVGGMHSMFSEVLPQQVFADQPPAPGGDVEAWADQLPRNCAGSVLRAGRDHRGAAAAGRGRDVRVRRRVPARDARGRRRARAGAGLRRDRDRVRPDRDLLRRRGGRRGAGHDVRRQGAHRRLPVAGRRAVHGRGRPRALRVGVGRADARPDLHGQPAGLLGRAGQPRPARVVRLVGQRGPGRRRARRRAGAAPRAAGCRRRAHDRRGGCGPARPPGRRGQGDRGGRRGGRVAAAVPRPRLRDAAVRHQRRGRGPHLRRDRAGGAVA